MRLPPAAAYPVAIAVLGLFSTVTPMPLVVERGIEQTVPTSDSGKPSASPHKLTGSSPNPNDGRYSSSSSSSRLTLSARGDPIFYGPELPPMF
ncbi:hypothetical protein FB446DRAFT_251174 [Lentinula raphanica]|nr:hypothetical protein FB446DRAFT_251174 [Lentinula raphanica]